jgi:hypothetical protein
MPPTIVYISPHHLALIGQVLERLLTVVRVCDDAVDVLTRSPHNSPLLG